MWLPSLFGSRKHPSSRSKSSKSRRDLNARRLFLEPLEDRRLMAFDPAVSYLTGDNPQAVATGHFNSDLFLDIAVANAGSDNVSVLLGNADGTFQSAVSFPTGDGPVSLAVGDFDEDGMLDLATANSGGDVSVLLGDGNGSFEAPTNISIGSAPVAVAVGDINADGNLDLAATSNVQLPGSYYYGYYGGRYYSPGPIAGYANVLLGNGQGGFAAPATTFLGYGSHRAANVTDLNGDGRGDFVTLNSDYAFAEVLLTTTAGTLGPVASYATGWYPQALTIGEFTSDGVLDLATAGQTVDILPGLGNGTFRPVVRQYIDPVSLAAADFNGDGKLDLVSAEPGANSVAAMLGLGTGAVTLALPHAAGTGTSAVAVGDFNRDGRADVVATGASSGDVSVLINDGAWPALTAPSLRISDAPAVTEGNLGTKDATFNVTLSAPSTQSISVNYELVFSSATSDDFEAGSGSVTFGPGETSKPITVKIKGDRLPEYSEYFSVSLTDPSGAFVADAVGWGTIYDDEPTVSITSYVSAAEGNSGTTAMNFAVTLSAAYDAPVTVDFATGDVEYWYGSAATAGVDYTANSGTVTFAPLDTTENITVLIQGDRLAEYSESFLVNLVGSNSAHLNYYTQATGTIVDDEPTVSINSTSGLEGNEGTKEFTFTVTLSVAHDEDVRVGYSTVSGTAAAGSDFEATSGEVIIPRGQTSQTVKVLISGDRVAEQSVEYYYDYYYGYYSYIEDSEYFSVNLTSADKATIASGQGTGTILDDEPRVSIGSASVVEGHEGTKVMNFPVTLAAPYDAPVTVTYATANGSATAGSDYQAATSSVTIPAGQTSQNIQVLVNGDRLSEYDESLYVNLTGATGAVISNSYGYGTIQDDEPRLSINSVSIREGQKGNKVMTFTVTLAAPSDQTVTVNYATHDSSAKAGEDYVATSGSLSFAPGQTSKTISVTIKGDRRKEWNESFYILLSGASSNAQISNAYGYGTIEEDDR